MVIPSSVCTLGSSAFNYCTKLTSVIITGSSITSIEAYAFQYCAKLTNIAIPDSVENIGSGAFNSCTSLKHITFKGSKYRWKSITKGTNWNYRVPATMVQCSDGTVELK